MAALLALGGGGGIGGTKRFPVQRWERYPHDIGHTTTSAWRPTTDNRTPITTTLLEEQTRFSSWVTRLLPGTGAHGMVAGMTTRKRETGCHGQQTVCSTGRDEIWRWKSGDDGIGIAKRRLVMSSYREPRWYVGYMTYRRCQV